MHLEFRMSPLFLLFTLPCVLSAPVISSHPLPLYLPMTGFQHQSLNLTLLPDTIYTMLSHPSFHVNMRWNHVQHMITPTEISILCGADQVHIKQTLKHIQVKINGHQMTNGEATVGNQVMHHKHDNSNTKIQVLTNQTSSNHHDIHTILIVSPLFAIKLEMTPHHTITPSFALLSRDWIMRGRSGQMDDKIELHGLIGQTWLFRDDRMMDGDISDYVAPSIWSTEGQYSRYRDDLYNHIDD